MPDSKPPQMREAVEIGIQAERAASATDMDADQRAYTALRLIADLANLVGRQFEGAP